MKQTLLIGLLSTVTLLAASTAVMAETPEEKGLRIAKEADAFDTGYGDFSSNMLMVLTNRAGASSKRVMRAKTLEGAGGKGDKSLSLFDQPADVKGTKMLTFSHGLKPDDQWLYLPALKRVKRINSRNKSGPFMGSEFAFEDLGSQEVEKYTYKFLREEPCGDGNKMKCHVIERIPAYKYSGYTKQVAWIDTQAYRVAKVMFYDRKNALLKTLTAHGYQQYLGKYWRPAKMAMTNHQSGKGTTLQWSDYKFKTGLTARDFNNKSLAR
uniref:Outer membrane lipoprotein-sorting protein n=1 Tax=uncultured Thiotrichaceae bacterium TaxID=298394 RepID=A0A6S6SXA5_9GAMM|nr:MAG: Outer membrane lipoprotein-sorting protein [uncultured Thiotrichaceae bacterium]